MKVSSEEEENIKGAEGYSNMGSNNLNNLTNHNGSFGLNSQVQVSQKSIDLFLSKRQMNPKLSKLALDKIQFMSSLHDQDIE